MIGALVGSLIAGPLADIIGRKHSISIWALVYMTGSLVELTSTREWAQIAVGRTVEGFGIGGLSILVPMYQGECSPKDARGVIISMYQLFITLGILLASLVNLGTKHIGGSASWRITIAVGTIWPLILAIGVQFLGESPRWDIRRNRVDRAERMVAKLYQTNEDIRRELDEIYASVQQERSQPKVSVSGIWRERTILRRIFVGVVLQMMQQLTGINYLFYFGTKLFSNMHVGDSYLTAVILGGANFFATLAGLWVTKRFGHRASLILGGVWIGVWLMMYAFFGQYCIQQLCPLSPSATGTAMVAFSCLAIFGFATTWGPLTWVVCSEIFPTRWKAIGMGVATATNWAFNFLIGFFTTEITDRIHYGLGWVFAGAIICGSCFVWFCVHETAGKSLEAIDKEILDGTRPWNSRKGQ
ncbi:hypothetical protein, variant 2 [Verruconis gallopava]|uniref:Major facilitator superfamily (MFS) profile domain-containing protein n=1 Tax=Verruconis gallopava TaxID=253628 RepID=A0A0D1YXB5_9PEZI|nr:hypothetical protein, variant 2 [Verruconis gallopava]KIW05347.1 hypothetical protein, variant 2 [Verruconis gallopava]